jgi:toxin ParE1/3/4
MNSSHSEAALEWYQQLKKAILSLRQEPNRCPNAPEKDRLRHLLYGHKPNIYRVIYRILEKRKCVEVLHIRHGARQELKASDLK